MRVGWCPSQVSDSWGEGLLQMWHKISQVSLHPVLQSLGNPVEVVTCYCHYLNKMDNWVWRSQALDLRQPAGSLIFSCGEEVSKGSSFLHQKFWDNQQEHGMAQRFWRHERSCQDLCSEGFLRAITWEPADFNLYIKLVSKGHVAMRNQKYSKYRTHVSLSICWIGWSPWRGMISR